MSRTQSSDTPAQTGRGCRRLNDTEFAALLDQAAAATEDQADHELAQGRVFRSLFAGHKAVLLREAAARLRGSTNQPPTNQGDTDD